MTMNTKNQTTTDLEASLLAAYARAQKLEADAKAERLELERAISLARGTGDVTEKAAVAVKITSAEPLASRLETLLRGPRAPITLVELARAANTPAGEVSKELRRMRNAKCPTRSIDDAPDARLVYNHGTDFEPEWSWVIGDQTSTAELSDAVEMMITRRPYTFAELTAATGARRGRLSGVLVKFQRDGRDIANENGTDRQYRWKMRPIRARRATRG